MTTKANGPGNHVCFSQRSSKNPVVCLCEHTSQSHCCLFPPLRFSSCPQEFPVVLWIQEEKTASETVCKDLLPPLWLGLMLQNVLPQITGTPRGQFAVCMDGHRGLNEPCSKTAVRKPSDLTVSVPTRRGTNRRLKFRKWSSHKLYLPSVGQNESARLQLCHERGLIFCVRPRCKQIPWKCRINNPMHLQGFSRQCLTKLNVLLEDSSTWSLRYLSLTEMKDDHFFSFYLTLNLYWQLASSTKRQIHTTIDTRLETGSLCKGKCLSLASESDSSLFIE